MFQPSQPLKILEMESKGSPLLCWVVLLARLLAMHISGDSEGKLQDIHVRMAAWSQHGPSDNSASFPEALTTRPALTEHSPWCPVSS